MAAMEEKPQDHGAGSLSPEFWELEVSADPAPGVSPAAGGAHFSEGAPGFAAHDPLEGHLDDDDDDKEGHSLTQEVHVSQGGDPNPDTDHDEEEPEQLQLAEQDPADTGGGRRRGRARRGRIPFSFTVGQVQELEAVFQDTQYPDILMRMELASALNVPESRVKVWFNNQRAKYRKAQRDALLRNAPPDSQDHIVIEEVEELL